MKLRTVISLSLVSLIAVVLIQLGGMLYAFHAQMQEAEKSLNKCFWMSFTETVDNLVNNLPYPDNSIAIIAYAPNPKYKRIDGDERNKRTSQQAAQALQRVYGIKEIPLATIDSVLHNKLRKLDMDGTLTVERINVNTNEVLATTNPQVILPLLLPKQLLPLNPVGRLSVPFFLSLPRRWRRDSCYCHSLHGYCWVRLSMP